MQPFKIFGIDLQNAFGLQGEPLCVPFAPADCDRIEGMIKKYQSSIKDIVLTIDTHPVDHIGHPEWWRLRDGSFPAPFTLVTPDMLSSGDIRPADPQQAQYAFDYLNALKAVMIWPVHCEPGTRSFEIVHGVWQAVCEWMALNPGRVPTIVKKGFNRDTESFGVFEAEFDNHDIGVDFNWHLVADLVNGALPIVVLGEARSHCVRRSIEQLVEKGADILDLSKIILVSDCMSDVPGFEKDGEMFLESMKNKGCTVCLLSELEQALA